jgi:hypothetical protein
MPIQAISAKEKLKGKDKNGYSDWEKQNLDTLEFIARQQYTENEKYNINEKIVNGEFIAGDYFECDEDDQFIDTLEQLIRDGKIPKFIKNYDIVAKVINTLVSIFDEYPDVFHVVGSGEDFQSERDKKQTELLLEWFDSKLEEQVDKMVGEIPEEADEEYLQKRQEAKGSLTPEGIGEYMKSFRHDYELWAEYKALDYKLRYNLKKLRSSEYRDFIINGLRARIFRVTSSGLQIQTINPRNLFFQKSENVEYIQDGDYAGLIYKASPQRTVDMFSAYLTSENIDEINKLYSPNQTQYNEKSGKDIFGDEVPYSPISGGSYNNFMPLGSRQLNNIAPEVGLNQVGFDPFKGVYNDVNFNSREIIITEAYWKSLEKVYTLSWINPETGIQEIIEVDEEFVFPNYIKKSKTISIAGNIPFNTAVESWNTVIYGGFKLRLPNNTCFYVKTGECEYQKTSPSTIIPKLPIFGQTSTNRGVAIRGIVDKLKPYLFLHNVAMNKAAKFQERGYLPFIAMDMKIMPKDKDWGADEDTSALAKWIGVGEDLGIAPIDTGLANTNGEGGGSGGQFPRVVDIDLTPRIIQQIQIAQSIKQMAYEEIGITQPLLGLTRQSDTATGINVGVNQSLHSISNWSKMFLECEKEMLQYSLEIAQWLESNNKDITVEYVNSNHTNGILKFANTNFNLFDWRIYIVDSQEELRRKKTFEDLALTNTLKLDVSERLLMTDKSTPSEKIVKIIQASEKRVREQEQKQFELEQQKLAANTQAEKDRIESQLVQHRETLASQERQAWIKSRGYVSEGEQDLDTNAIPDAFEYDKFVAKSSQELEKLGLMRDKVEIDRKKEESRVLEKSAEHSLKQRELDLKQQQIEQTAKNVKILDKGPYKK